MATIELAFPVMSSQPIPADHGYLLYAALSRVLPELHQKNGVAVHPIRGQQIGNRQLGLTDHSRLVLRTDSDTIGQLIQVAGKKLSIAGASVRVGVPQVRPLKPATALRSRLVVIKVKDAPAAAALNEENFRQAARRQLDDLHIANRVMLAIGKRRTLTIKDKEVVGYEMILERLTAEESLNVQEKGVGGRRHMGCGVFVHFRSRN